MANWVGRPFLLGLTGQYPDFYLTEKVKALEGSDQKA